MAIYPAPMLVLAPSLLVGLGLAGRGAWQRKGAGSRPGLRVPIAAVLAFVVLGGLSFAWFDAWDRRGPVLVGLALGLVLGVLWEWAFPPAEADAAELGPLGAGIAALAALGLAIGPGVPFANAALGVMAGWGVLQVLAVTMAATDVRAPGRGLALAVVGLAAGGAAWGARLPVHAGVDSGLWPLAIGLAALVGVALALAELAGERRAGLAGAAIAAVVFALGGLALAGGPFQQPPLLLAGLAAGAVVGLFAAGWLPREGDTSPLVALTFLVVAGALLVVENRLMGILAIAWGGLGLAAGARGERGPRKLVVVAIAIFAARVWLQLFLDRTLLTGYGVDLTHPYAFAALIVGGLLPTAALAVGRLVRGLPSLAVGWALVLALLPAWLGYLIHVEALGGLLAGLVLATFTLGARGGEEATEAADALALVPPLLLLSLGVTMLASPWLVAHMNAPRDQRTLWFLASLVVALVALGRWWLATRRPAAA